MPGTLNLDPRVERAVTDVVRRRFVGADENRVATLVSDIGGPVWAELRDMTTDALALVAADAIALRGLAERHAIALKRAEAFKSDAPVAYRADEIRVRGIVVEDLTIPEMRALVGRLTTVDSATATPEKLRAVLHAIVTAGVWEARTLRPGGDASHVGHLLQLVSDASRASLQESAWADALRDACNVDSLRGPLGDAVRAIAHASPAWVERQQSPRDEMTRWTPARHAIAVERLTRYRERVYRRGLRAHRAGDVRAALAAVAYLANASAHKRAVIEPATSNVSHDSDACAPTPERIIRHRDGSTSRVPSGVAWETVCAETFGTRENATAKRLTRDVRQWAALVTGRAFRAVHANAPEPAPWFAPWAGRDVRTDERVTYFVRTAASDAERAHRAAVERNAARWYASGRQAWARGDKRTAWAVVAMLANACAPRLADSQHDASASPSPAARVTAEGSARGHSGAHAVTRDGTGRGATFSDPRYSGPTTEPAPRPAPRTVPAVIALPVAYRGTFEYADVLAWGAVA